MPYLIAFALFTATFCMVGKRLEGSPLTAPMAFLAFGAVMAQSLAVPAEASERLLHLVAEVALVVVLFLDAAQIDVLSLRRNQRVPVRMLALGMPLAFVAGAVLATMLFPGWPLAVALLVAAILVPTDAALGQPVVANRDVPERTRGALTVESGLNDGLALPVILMLASLAAPVADAPAGGWLLFGLGQITLGPLAGVAIGCAGGYAMILAQSRNWTSETFEGIAALSLAALAYVAATAIGGNGFISAFAAGLGFGAVVRGRCAFVYEFTESEGQFLSWAAFFLLGAVLLPDAVAHLTWPMATLILASLLIARPLAIWIALSGSRMPPLERLFLGWFGPRGLATALFALLVAEQLAPDRAETILHVAVNAVWMSAALHGLTAAPGARWFAARARTASAAPPESALKPARDRQ